MARIGTGSSWPVRHRRTLVAAAVIVTLAAVSSVWLTHARLLIDTHGVEQRMTAAAGDVVYADAIIFPLGSPNASVDVTIASIKPRVADNSAGATVDILVCTQSDAGRIAIVTGSIDEYCASAAPWQPGEIRLGQMSSTYLMYAITSSQPGAVRIDGADVSFRKGMRWGGQWVGGNIAITFER